MEERNYMAFMPSEYWPKSESGICYGNIYGWVFKAYLQKKNGVKLLQLDGLLWQNAVNGGKWHEKPQRLPDLDCMTIHPKPYERIQWVEMGGFHESWSSREVLYMVHANIGEDFGHPVLLLFLTEWRDAPKHTRGGGRWLEVRDCSHSFRKTPTCSLWKPKQVAIWGGTKPLGRGTLPGEILLIGLCHSFPGFVFPGFRFWFPGFCFWFPGFCFPGF
jgi:hypothetical protein